MSFKIYFISILLISISIVVRGQRKDDDCEAYARPIESCSQIISSDCNNATFIADRLAYSEECSSVSLFWDAPMYNMTVLFQSHLTKPYSVCIQPVGCVKSYRTLDDGREVQIEWTSFNREPVCFKTERSDRPIMKFRFDAGSVWHCYGTFINFSYRF